MDTVKNDHEASLADLLYPATAWGLTGGMAVLTIIFTSAFIIAACGGSDVGITSNGHAVGSFPNVVVAGMSILFGGLTGGFAYMATTVSRRA